MLRLLTVALLLLAACGSTTYSAEEDARDTCTALGHSGEAHAQCMARRAHQERCRRFVNSRDYSAAEARRRGCEPD
jgi:hypothetical protein